MKLRPLIHACLVLPLLASWLGASSAHQIALVACLGIFLELVLLRPLSRLSERARKLDVYPGDSIISEVSAMDRAMVHLESRFDRRLQEVQREEQQVRALLSALPDPVLHFDGDHTLLYLNPAAEVALELHRQDLIGRSLAANWTELLRPPQADATTSDWNFEKPGKALLERVEQAQRAGLEQISIGSQRTYRSLLIPFQSTQKVLVLRDITDLRRLEEVRQLFLSSISHELRTPLTIIKGFAVTLLDHPDLPKDFEKPLKRMDGEADRLTRLVNDLLDLSQIQSRRISLELAPFDARELLEETVSMLKPLADRRDIAMLWAPGPEPQVLYADRDRVKQILINLIDNAIKFTPNGGQVFLESHVRDQWWQFRVQDTGPGVARSELGSLFDHFFRGKHSRKVVGSGLGLAIVKEIVSLHQGHVEASCDPLSDGPSGLTVLVSLPRHRPQ